MVDPDPVAGDYGHDEGMVTKDVLKRRPGRESYRDGCLDGESSEEVAARADNFLARFRPIAGDVLASSSGHIAGMIAARWPYLPPADVRRFSCRSASVGVLSFEHRNRGQPILSLRDHVAMPRE